MNYRHAFHAGNFADCTKHALLVRLVRALLAKPKPFAVLDTHAGVGRYSLDSLPAQRTGEWQAGIARLLHDPPEALHDYVGLVDQIGLYPGSPALVRALLRPDDRITCCELHPEDYRALRRMFLRDQQVAVHRRDGYEALGALLPPKERRGLVLVDPPFEQPDEFARLAAGLGIAASRFPAGVLAAWYPIKGRAPVRDFHAALQRAGLRDLVAAELLLRDPVDAARLNGCGLVVRNAPFGFAQDAPAILQALKDRLCTGEPGEGWALLRLTDE